MIKSIFLWGFLAISWMKDVNGACSTALGMASGYISDNQISASSQLSILAGPSYARLYHRSGLGGWCASNRDQHPYLQIDLLTAHTITKVATQGANSNWVQKFTLTFSYDNINWFNYTVNGKIKVFTGNRNQYMTKWNYLTQPLTARLVRFHPMHDPDIYTCLRVELYGCGSPDVCKDLPTEVSTSQTSREPYVTTKSSSSLSTFSPSTSKDPLSETTTSQTSRSPDISAKSSPLPSTFSPSTSKDPLSDEVTTKKPNKSHKSSEPRKPHEPNKPRALELQNHDDDCKWKIVFGICVTIIIMLLVGLVFYAISYRQKRTDGFEIMPDDTKKSAQTARGYSFQNPVYFVREGDKQEPVYNHAHPAYKTTDDPDRESRL